MESNLTAADPVTQEIKKNQKNLHLPHPNFSGVLSTGGGLVFFMDGTVAAFDDTSLDQLWKINIGSAFSAPPVTFEVNGIICGDCFGYGPGERKAPESECARTQPAAKCDRAIRVRL
jgi:hypothetical protein